MPLRRSPWDEPDAVKSHQSGLRSNPKISVSGLGHHVGRPGKNSILYPPCGVPILRDLPAGIECVDWTWGEEKQDKAEQKQSRSVSFHCRWSETYNWYLTRFPVELFSHLLA